MYLINYCFLTNEGSNRYTVKDLIVQNPKVIEKSQLEILSINLNKLISEINFYYFKHPIFVQNYLNNFILNATIFIEFSIGLVGALLLYPLIANLCNIHWV